MRLPSTVITGAIQKVIETNKGYIINGHYYSNETKNMQGGFTLPVSSTEIKEMSLTNMKGRCASSWNNMNSGKNYLVDKNDPEITYVFVSGSTSTTVAMFLKLREKDDGSCELISYKKLGIALGQGEMIWDDDTSFLMTGQTAHNSITLYTVDKETLVQTAIRTNGYGYFKKVWEDLSYVYLLGRTSAANSQTFQIYSYSKALKTLVINELDTNTPTSAIIPIRTMSSPATTVGFNVLDSIIQTGATTYTIYAGFLYAENTALKIRRIKLDFSKTKGPALNSSNEFLSNWCTTDDVFSYSVAGDEIPYFSGVTYHRFTLFPIVNPEYDEEEGINIDKLYLGVGYAESFGASSATVQPKAGLYIYEMKETFDHEGSNWTDSGLVDDDKGTAGELVKRDYINLLNTSDYLREVFPVTANNEFIAMLYATRIHIAKLNRAELKYEVVKDISVNARMLGTDKFGYLYAISSDDVTPSMIRINLLDSSSVYVELEKYQYSYTGEPIESYCTVTARDIANAPVEMEVDLIGSGNIVFAESNGQRVTVEIPAVEEGIKVNFTITSPQTIEIQPVAHIE